MFGLWPKRDETKRKEHEPRLSESERRIVLIGVTVVLVLAAVASVFLETASHPSGSSNCSGIVFQQQRDSCYYQAAFAARNSSECAHITGSSTRYACFAAIAENLRSVAVCNGINATSYDYANCVMNVTLMTGNYSGCSALSGQSASTCIYEIASKQQFSNIGACHMISNHTLMESCLGAHYYDAAVSHGSASYCGLVPNNYSSSVMGAILSQGGNVSSPEEYLIYSSINATPANYCYYRIAMLTYNRSVCSSTTGLLAALCNETFEQLNATATYNLTTVCSSAPSYLQSLCEFGAASQLAVSNENVSYCSSISSAAYRYACISTLAAKTGNAAYCSGIPNATISSACVGSAENATNSTHT